MTDKTIKWGVLGFARIAKGSVIPAILKHDASEFYAIASRSADKLRACQDEFGCEKTYPSYGELLDDPDVQAVYIPLPNSQHKEWAINAMERGKHVLCEKPISMNAAECAEMIEAATKNNVQLMEAFMYRYTDRTKKVLELLNGGVIGDVKVISSTHRFFLDRPNTIKAQPELGGGSLYDVGSYPVNFVGMVMNELPVSYQAEAIIEDGVDVCFSGVLRYESGVIATVHSGFNAYKNLDSQIIGTQGIIDIVDTFAGNPGTIRVTTAAGEEEIAVEESDRYCLEVANFADALLGKEAAILPLEESLRNMTVIENLLKAADLKLG